MFRWHRSQQNPSKARSWSQQTKSADCGSSSSSERVSLRLQVYKDSWSGRKARLAGCGGFQHSPGISASQRVAAEHAHESGIIGFLNLQPDPRPRVCRSRQANTASNQRWQQRQSGPKPKTSDTPRNGCKSSLAIY